MVIQRAEPVKLEIRILRIYFEPQASGIVELCVLGAIDVEFKRSLDRALAKQEIRMSNLRPMLTAVRPSTRPGGVEYGLRKEISLLVFGTDLLAGRTSSVLKVLMIGFSMLPC